MSDPRWERIATLFGDLVDCPEEARARFWDAHVDVPQDVRDEVLALMAAHEAASRYLEAPIMQPGTSAPATGAVIGPWRLAEEIGQGGMSTVYRAERIEGGYTQRAAIKLIALPALPTRQAAEVMQRRFEAERQIVARLEHPDICRLLDGGLTTDGVPYLVLEYVDGVDVVSFTRNLDDDARLEVLIRVARAVHYAHQRLVVHRDLKPSNVLVTADGSPKLLDFGIAKTLAPDDWDLEAVETRTVFRAATPAFASPEQLRGDVVTTATDVYALGKLVGKVFADRMPPDVDAIVARATRPEAGERYASASDLADDLDRVRQGHPVEARQGNLRYLAGKFVRRHLVPVTLAAALVLVLVSIAIVTRVQMRRVEQERQRATQIADFMRGLFQASNPELNQGNRVTTRELLDEGARRIRQTPLPAGTRDALIETIADAYAGLGMHRDANDLYASLLPHEAGGPRPASPDVVLLSTRLAKGHSQLGEHAEAERHATRAVSAAAALSPSLQALALEAHCDTLSRAARHGEATPVCAAAADQARRSTLDALDRVRILRSYGDSLKETSAYDESETTLREALDLVRRSTTGPHVETATTLNALGALHFRQGSFDKALAVFQEAIAAQRALYPDGHADLARSLNNLANTHATMRRVDDAIPIYVEAHAIYRRYLGEGHGELATSLSNLAVTQQIARRLDDALATLTRVREMHAQATGREKLPYLSTQLKLANLLLEMGRPAEAAAAAGDAATGMDALDQPPDVDRGFARVVLAASLIEAGRASDAAAAAQEGRGLLQARIAPTHWMMAYADSALGGALALTGQRDAGRRLLDPHYGALPQPAPADESWRAAWIRRMWTRAQESAPAPAPLRAP